MTEGGRFGMEDPGWRIRDEGFGMGIRDKGFKFFMPRVSE
jgi:hypothetical protein